MTAFKFINLWQSNEERRQKYWLARSLGANAAWAVTMRDWRLSKIERRFGIDGKLQMQLLSVDPQSNIEGDTAPYL